MKNTYRVQYMTKAEYMDYMGGAMFCNINTIDVKAESAQEAVNAVKAMHPDMVVNENPRTVAEIEAENKAWEEKFRAEEEKKAAAKARREARDIANGITPEKRKAINNLKRHENNVKGLEYQIAELMKELEIEKKIVERKKAEIEKM